MSGRKRSRTRMKRRRVSPLGGTGENDFAATRTASPVRPSSNWSMSHFGLWVVRVLIAWVMIGFRVAVTFRAIASRSRHPTAREHLTASGLWCGGRLQLSAFNRGERDELWPRRLPLEVVQRGNLHAGAFGVGTVNGLAVVAQGFLGEPLWVAARPRPFRPGVAITM